MKKIIVFCLLLSTLCGYAQQILPEVERARVVDEILEDEALERIFQSIVDADIGGE